MALLEGISGLGSAKALFFGVFAARRPDQSTSRIRPSKADLDAARYQRQLEERNLLQGIPGLTGRDIAGWMALIDAQSFIDKNDTIDFLRGFGFPFAWASWLERVHANGGRPLFGPEPTPEPARRRLGAGIEPTRSAVQIPGMPPPLPAPVGSAPTRAPAPARPPGPLYISAEKQAKGLVEWLRQRGVHGEVKAREVMAAYDAMCTEHGWQTHNWNQVGKHFRRLLGGGKPYRDFEAGKGRKKDRLCVYYVPKPKPSPVDAPPVAEERRAA